MWSFFLDWTESELRHVHTPSVQQELYLARSVFTGQSPDVRTQKTFDPLGAESKLKPVRDLMVSNLLSYLA